MPRIWELRPILFFSPLSFFLSFCIILILGEWTCCPFWFAIHCVISFRYRVVSFVGFFLNIAFLFFFSFSRFRFTLEAEGSNGFPFFYLTLEFTGSYIGGSLKVHKKTVNIRFPELFFLNYCTKSTRSRQRVPLDMMKLTWNNIVATKQH